MKFHARAAVVAAALACTFVQAQNTDRRAASRDATAEQRRYAVVLAWSTEDEAKLPRAFPRHLQDYELFTRSRIVDGARRSEILVGYFATRTQAESALAGLSGFPQAAVVALVAEGETAAPAATVARTTSTPTSTPPPTPTPPSTSPPTPAAPAPSAPTAAAPGLPAAPVGERRVAPTADQVALRDQAQLVPRGRLTAELGLSYSRAEQSLLLGQRIEQNSLDATFGLRYGLRDGLQLSASVPGRRTRTAIVTAPGSPVPSSKESRSAWQDPSLALLGMASDEGPGRPALLWNVQAIVPGGAGDAGVGGGLIVTKSADPAILFAGLSYIRGLRVDPNDPERSLARHNVAFNLGNAIALNDVVALTGQVAGSYRTYRAPDGGVAPPRERYQLKLGVTYVLTPKLYYETQIAIGLGGTSPDFTLSLNIPYSF